jgi:hypothetical protein
VKTLARLYGLRHRRVVRWARVLLHRAGAPGHTRKPEILLVGLAAILAWQVLFSVVALDSRYRNTASVGTHQEGRFAYFWVYKGLFPVATTITSPPPGSAGADWVIRNHPETLVQDLTYTWLSGDYGKVIPHLFDTWLRGEPLNTRMIPFNRMLFMFSLCSLFAAFWYIHRPLLGLVMVVLLGSNPFQLFHVYAHDNVIGLPITTAILMLALHLPWLTRARLPARYTWALPIVTGVLLASIRTIRSEPAPIILAALGTYLTLFSWPWRRRLALVALLMVSFIATGSAWRSFFLKKHSEARAFLASVGGNPYPGEPRLYHHFWHPVWCGLGDFDTKYGYKWSDKVALVYATPILETKYGIKVPIYDVEGKYGPEEYYDARRVYKRLPFQIPEYDQVARDKVLHDIAHDPIWYAGILAKRAWRVLDEQTPVRVAIGSMHRFIPMHGLVALGLLLGCLAFRQWFLAKLVGFTMPTLTTAMFVYSGDGVSYYGIYHIVAAAILLTLTFTTVHRFARGYRARRGARVAQG